MLASLRWPPQGLDALQLLGQCRALQTTRLRQLLMALLGLGVLALLGLVAMQAWLGYPPVRYVALTLASLALMASMWLVRGDRLRAASAALLWGVAAAVSAQSLVAGGLHNPGLFAYPALVVVTGGMLGLSQARAMLVLMLLVVAVLAAPGGTAPWGWQPVEPSPPLLRACVLAVFLVLSFVGLRLFMRSHQRDVQAIEALNRKLGDSIDLLRQREAELQRMRQDHEALNQVLNRRLRERSSEVEAAVQRSTQLEGQLRALEARLADQVLALSSPLSTAKVCASTLEACSHDLLALLQRPAGLRRSELALLAQRCLDSAGLAQRSLDRASTLLGERPA
jgi:ABC-type multidrug transport system fused ATPase/permease subunit